LATLKDCPTSAKRKSVIKPSLLILITTLFYIALSHAVNRLSAYVFRKKDNMTENTTLKKICFDADPGLINAIQLARKQKQQYKGETVSNKMAYEIGAKLLLGIKEHEDKEAIKRKLEEVQIQKDLFDSQSRLLTEELNRLEQEENNRAEEEVKAEGEVKTLAGKIKECWNKVYVYGQPEHINYIVALNPEKLNRNEVSKVFPKTYQDTPTEEEALKIASKLLGVV